MTTASGKNPPKPSPKATTNQLGQEQSVGPLTQLLIRARQRIKDPAHWARGAYARKKDGNPCDVQDPEAVCWCAVGSLEREAGNHVPSWIETPGETRKVRVNEFYQPAHALLQRASQQIMNNKASTTVLNDGSGHAAVMKAYNTAIKDAKGR